MVDSDYSSAEFILNEKTKKLYFLTLDGIPNRKCDLNVENNFSYSVGAFGAVNHKGLHQGWTQTSLYLQVIHKSFYHKSCFWAYLYSTGTQHGNLHPTGWPILFCGPTQEPVIATADTEKKLGEVWKKCRWMDRKGRNKQRRNKSLAVSVACMAIYWPTLGFKGRTFKLCILNRWDLNFCIRSFPPRDLQ